MQEQNQQCSRDLAFFGTITASVTHELNNVFSIINELAGLLDDMTYSIEPSSVIECARVNKTAQNIAKQIVRGVSIIKRMNRFAHSMDEPIREIVLSSFLEDLAGLMQRFANLKNVPLNLIPGEEVSLTTNPFILFHTLFTIVHLAVVASEKKKAVEITWKKQEKDVQIIITSALIEKEKFASLAFLKKMLEDLKGNVELTPREDQIISCIFPYKIL